MAERHVREAEVRIAKQKEIVAELDRNGHKDLTSDARKLLATFEDIQRLGREHVEREKRKHEDGG